MQKPPNKDARKLVPRWRQFERTPSNELLSSETSHNSGEIDAQFQAALAAWEDNRNVNTALQVAEFAMLGAESAKSAGALEFLLTQDNLRSEVKERLVAKPLSDIETNEILEIGVLKKKIATFPKHAMLHCEIARLYTALGQIDQAKKHLEIALKLSPENRYIVRSFVRFFVHSGDNERALSALKFTLTTNDPWLLSANVATADLANSTKSIPLKRIRNLLNSDIAPFQTTELAGSLATLELGSGKVKVARKLFQKSALAPNDNSLAQIGWANREASFTIRFEPATVPLSFEAATQELEEKEDWRNSIEACKNWSRDEQFSSRPFIHGSFLASEYMQDYATSLWFSDQGLTSNPKNATLLNNRAYALSELGRYEEAKSAIDASYRNDENNDAKIAILATRGHINLNTGDFHNGVNWYQQAIETAANHRCANRDSY